MFINIYCCKGLGENNVTLEKLIISSIIESSTICLEKGTCPPPRLRVQIFVNFVMGSPQLS